MFMHELVQRILERNELVPKKHSPGQTAGLYCISDIEADSVQAVAAFVRLFGGIAFIPDFCKSAMTDLMPIFDAGSSGDVRDPNIGRLRAALRETIEIRLYRVRRQAPESEMGKFWIRARDFSRRASRGE